MFDLTSVPHQFLGEDDEYLRYKDKELHYGVYSGPYEYTFYLHKNRLCPLCGAYTESYTDCPGYKNQNGTVMICGDSYSESTVTGKFVFAQVCGNSMLYVCINPSCDWEWRTHNSRSGVGIDPSWKQEAESEN